MVKTFKGKRVAISGSGNVAQYAALKVIELGGTVVSLSDSKGSIISKNGITADQVYAIAAAKLKFKSLEEIVADSVQLFSGDHSVEYLAGVRPWTKVGQVDVALPSAKKSAVKKPKLWLMLVVNSLLKVLIWVPPKKLSKSLNNRDSNGVWYAPGKAANCGGVAVSGLEMAQNSQRVQWTNEEVDAKLKEIMYTCFENCYKTAQKYSIEKNENGLPSLLKGANIAGFIKVADAMFDQGDVF